jgi:DNA-binding beta-propeller fold protein YncE
MPHSTTPLAVPLALLALLALTPARADVAISANDAHSAQVEGVAGAVKDPPPDNLSVIDLSASPPRITATVEVGTSVVGPGQGIYVAKDESFAIVPAASKLENGVVVPDNRVSVIELNGAPRVFQQVTAGAGANAVAVNPAENLALVTNRNDGNVTVFALKDKHLTRLETIDLGNPKSLAAGVVFSTDGKTAFVARDGGISVFTVRADGLKEEPGLAILALRPYAIDLSPDGHWLAIGNAWGGPGNIGAITLVDVSARPFKVVSVAEVHGVSEGLRFSPDGKHLAASSLNGSTAASTSPDYRDHGLLTIFALDGRTLRKADEAPIGHWSQGIAFSRDGHTLLVQNMAEKNISVFTLTDGRLSAQPPLAIPSGGPAMFGTARR